jgi:diguanylate cyclase (GGDEF)-like protein
VTVGDTYDAFVPREQRSNPLDSPLLRSQVTGALLMAFPSFGIAALALIPGEAAPGVDRVSTIASLFIVLVGLGIYRFGRTLSTFAYNVIATLGFAAISILHMLNAQGNHGVDVAPLYGVVLMVVGLFLPIRHALIQAFFMSTFALVGFLNSDPSVSGAFGRWIISVLWAAVGGVIVTTLRFRLGQIFRSLTIVAETDALTGLTNRAQFLAQLELDVANHPQVAIVLLDLDGFKEVNDHFGHRAGDHVLRSVADRLRSLPGTAMVARLGGDEFAYSLNGLGSGERAQSSALALIELLEEPISLGDFPVYISASLGIEVTDPSEHLEVISVLQRSDVAMYKAKSEKLGVCIYTPELDADQRRRRRLLADLETAIKTNQISLCYQPKVDLRTNRVVGVEALARWEHPDFGVVPPSEFVGMAEQSGSIYNLTTAVLDHAIAQCRAWLDLGVTLSVAVNVSSRNFTESFADQVAVLLNHHRVPASLLMLEVTERRFTDDTIQARAVLTKLRAFGVRIAIDDFGTGYSSLAHLRVLPVDELKIDQSFVCDMDTDPESALITQAAIQLARNMGLLVVAEGVENEAVARCLQELGCDMAQGYYYAKPLTAQHLCTFLTERGDWAYLRTYAVDRHVSPGTISVS